MSEQIIAEDLNFSYNQHQVLENVNLSIKKNQIITVVGPNGGGKTTLLKLIAGLLKPDSGKVLINGKSPGKSRGMIGYVPQHSQIDKKFPITVFEVVQSGLIRPLGFYSKRDKAQTHEVLKYMDLINFKDRPFNNLSGGQIQRMFIARALVSDASILLLDEPTANIDAQSEHSLNGLLKDLSSKMTIVLVTHDTAFVDNITERVFCVNKTVVEHLIESEPDNVITSPYGANKKIVRHDTVISGKHTEGCKCND